MKMLNSTTDASNTIVGGDVGQTNQFSVKIDGHIFKTLIDGMYSAKVPSVVREILANAFDAHIAAGNITDAVAVRLPTIFNPHFRVRDFGHGMTHDFVMQLYTQLGHSEKRDTNAQTGMFGLGSKSPFSISDQFQVTVFDGTQKRVYSAYIDTKDGIPRLANPVNIPSTEPSGVEVLVPVSERQVYEFEYAVKHSALAYFDKNITFNRDFSHGTEPLKWARDGVKMLNDDLYASDDMDNGFYVRQGFAVYPLALNDLATDDLAVSDLTQGILRLVANKHRAIMFDAPLGTFNMTASREKIQFDDISRLNLVELIENTMKSFIDELRAHLGDAWNYKMARNNLQSALGKIDVTSELAVLEKDIMANWTAHIKTPDYVPIMVRTSISSYPMPLSGRNVLQPSKTVVLREEIGGSEMFYAVSGYFSERDGVIQGVCSGRKDNHVSVGLDNFVIVIPNSTAHWVARMGPTMSKILTESGRDFTRGKTVNFCVIRCKKADVERVIKTFTDQTAYILDKVYTIEDVAEIPKDLTHQIKSKRKGYKQTAVTPGNVDNLGWESYKIDAEADSEAYYVVRDGRHDSVIVDDDNSDYGNPFAAYDLVANSPTPTFKASRQLRDANFFTAVRAAITLDLIDTDIPIYRITEKQYLTIGAKQPKWINLGPQLTEWAFEGYRDCVAPVSQSHVANFCDASAPALNQVVKDISSLMASDPTTAAGVKASMPLFHKSLAGIRMLLDRDLFVVSMLERYISYAGSPLLTAGREMRARALTYRTLANLMAYAPNTSLIEVNDPTEELQQTLYANFTLTRFLNAVNEEAAPHLIGHLLQATPKKVLNVESIPELGPIFAELKDAAIAAIDKAIALTEGKN